MRLIIKNLRFNLLAGGQKGNIMVESIVAISISVIGLLGIVGLLSRSIAINKDVGQKFVATYLAAEGVEIVKGIIDANYTATPRRAWNAGLPSNDYEAIYNSAALSSFTGNSLRFNSASGIYDYNSSNPATHYVRKIQISDTTDEIKVVSIINWTERGVAKTVKLEDHFYNWRQ